MVEPRGSDRAAAFVATTAALRRHLVALALEVARVEEELAKTLDRLAASREHRAEEIRARAAAARQFAERERGVARNFADGP